MVTGQSIRVVGSCFARGRALSRSYAIVSGALSSSWPGDGRGQGPAKLTSPLPSSRAMPRTGVYGRGWASEKREFARTSARSAADLLGWPDPHSLEANSNSRCSSTLHVYRRDTFLVWHKPHYEHPGNLKLARTRRLRTLRRRQLQHETPTTLLQGSQLVSQCGSACVSPSLHSFPTTPDTDTATGQKPAPPKGKSQPRRHP